MEMEALRGFQRLGYTKVTKEDYEVENIYDVCGRLQSNSITILRPPRDEKMAFVKDPNSISIELLQKNKALQPQEPWVSMANVGSW